MNDKYKDLNYRLSTLLVAYDYAILAEGVEKNIPYQIKLEKLIKETRDEIQLLLNNK